METFDEKGTLRVGLDTDPTGSGPNGLGVYDANGKLRIGVSQSLADGNAFYLEDKDGTTVRGVLYSGDAGDAVNLDLFDAAGTFRTGLDYDPTIHFFNGFVSQDGSGHNLSPLGNVLAPSGVLAANDSFMQLLDTTGTVRVAEFQNSTNQGGVDYNAGSTTVQGSWGNP